MPLHARRDKGRKKEKATGNRLAAQVIFEYALPVTRRFLFSRGGLLCFEAELFRGHFGRLENYYPKGVCICTHEK